MGIKLVETEEPRGYMLWLYNQQHPIKIVTKVNVIEMYRTALDLAPTQTRAPLFVIPDDEDGKPVFVASLSTVQAVLCGVEAPPPAQTKRA